jgi:predicted nucleotidyltransferase
METTKNAMPEYNNIFFEKLKIYLDSKIYFFGSVQRDDYFPNGSDIDISIFTDNVNSILTKLSNFLNITRQDFKKIFWRLNYDDTLVTGYKYMHKEPDKNFVVEISIYNEKYKHGILMEQNGKRDLPYYATFLLIIIKYLYYTLNIIPIEWYISLKKIILTKLIFKDDDDYITLKY